MEQSEIRGILEGKGVQPSLQRIRVYEFLWNHRTHPTVDDIYSKLLPEMPTLSRTTVYNTVKLFAEKGVVQALTIENEEMRYDADISPHGHFKCDDCGQVFDFEVSAEAGKEELPGFYIRERHWYYRGLCPKCYQKSH